MQLDLCSSKQQLMSEVNLKAHLVTEHLSDISDFAIVGNSMYTFVTSYC